MRPSNDPRLIEIAKTFHSIQPFPDPEPFAEHLEAGDGRFRHYSIMPGGKILGARFFLKGRHRYVAYAVAARQVDLLRFADLVTMKLWKNMSRSKHREISDGDLNFPVDMVRQDMMDFETDRPEIMAMLDAIEQHFLELGLIRDLSVPVDPALDPRKKNRKTARSEFLVCHKAGMAAAEQRHQEILDAMAALSDQLGDLAKRLEVVEAKLNQPAPMSMSDPFVVFNPTPPDPQTVSTLQSLEKVCYPVQEAKDHLVENTEWKKLDESADLRLPSKEDFKSCNTPPNPGSSANFLPT